MAAFKRANKISARPQIQAVQQPVSRPVITPQTRIPSIAPNFTSRPFGAARKTPVQQAPVVPTSTPVQPAVLAPVNNQDMLNLYRQIQNQITNPTNPLYYNDYITGVRTPFNTPQTNEPAQAPAPVNYESYGFDKGLVDYLNNQREMSYTDAGIGYSYDPATQTFKGLTMGGPVTKTLAQIQAEAQNYANRPVYNPRNPLVSNFSGSGQLGVAQNPSTLAPAMGESSVGSIGYPAGGGTTTYQSGFGQPLVPYTPNQPNYQNIQPNSGIQQLQGQLGMQQQNFGGMGQSPYQASPMMGNNMAQPFNQTMPQTGFVPMGGYDPQNTSYGSFGAIQQPMGGFQNIGSLLGKG